MSEASAEAGDKAAKSLRRAGRGRTTQRVGELHESSNRKVVSINRVEHALKDLQIKGTSADPSDLHVASSLRNSPRRQLSKQLPSWPLRHATVQVFHDPRPLTSWVPAP